MICDQPQLSRIGFDERSGVWRRCLPAGRMEPRCHFWSASSSSSTNKNYTGGTLAGQSGQAIGEGNTTNSGTLSYASDASNKQFGNTTLTVTNGGTLNFSPSGITSDALTALGGIFGSGGGSSPMISATPPTAQVLAQTNSSIYKWAIAGVIGLVLLILMLKKK